jgi:uncharacterized membrane protein (Fun14 family)
MNTLMLMSSKGVIGGVSGYMLGRFTKQITDIAIFYAGLTVLLVGGLNWMHWITINWSVIDEDLLHIWVRAKNRAKDSGIVSRFKRFAMRTIPLCLGFVGGFKLAFLGSKDEL